MRSPTSYWREGRPTASTMAQQCSTPIEHKKKLLAFLFPIHLSPTKPQLWLVPDILVRPVPVGFCSNPSSDSSLGFFTVVQAVVDRASSSLGDFYASVRRCSSSLLFHLNSCFSHRGQVSVFHRNALDYWAAQGDVSLVSAVIVTVVQ